MGLKFRRGTTAQQSGSLAFGEPYVNTTLGTLVIGGQSGDIVLSSGGTGSTGNFGAISGSGLDITGNANIAGNLTLGGELTIGNQTSDTVNVVASLSSSLIPQTTNVFDLGSASKIWRDLYISTGSIKFVEGNTVVKSLSAATLTALETSTGSANASITSLNSYTSSNDTTNTAQSTRLTTIESVTGSYETKGSGIVSGSSQITYASISSIPAGIVSGSSQITYASISSIPAGIVSGSAQVTPLLPTGVVSGSSQVTGIGNAQLTNSSTTIGTTAISLGASSTTLVGLTSVTSTGFTGALTGNASTATTAAALTTARTINGTSFDGSANITIPNLVSGSAQVTLSSTTGGGTSAAVQFGSLGIGMAASVTTGRIDATNDIVAFSSSDIRFKENIKPIENAIDKIRKISGNTYDWKEENKVEHGYEGNDVGVIAQEIEAVLPQLVQTRESGFKAVKYDKLVALLIEGIKEQQLQIEKLRMDLDNYECKCDNCKSE
jgi:hypothetical protein